ncbi:MAG: DUF4831 family protein [Alistipes sp.]|nr:DUF4831 family protein [Alistipes sp.]
MKKLVAILTFVGVAISGVAQNITKAGLYDIKGADVVSANTPVVVNVSLRVVKTHFTPGIYARYAQDCLGEQVPVTARTTVELCDGSLALGEVKKPAATINTESERLLLPLNKLSATHQEPAEAAKATADMIFSLRKSRIDLITGEAGENVFGAGLKAALEEIARLEKAYLEMFYGTTTIVEELHTFNVAITSADMEYTVCRFNEKEGVVALDDLSGKPIVIKVATAKVDPYQTYPVLKQPKGKNSWFTAEYLVVPQSKCELIGDATLMDTISFASPLFGEKVISCRIK